MDAFASDHSTAARRFDMTRPSERALVIAVATIGVALAFYYTIWALSSPNMIRPMPGGAGAAGTADAMKTMSTSERKALLDREISAFRSDPLDPMALKNLSTLLRAEANSDRAERLAVLAGDRSLRDLPAQAEVLDILLKRKDFAGALYRLDALMRAQPARMPVLIKIAALFAEDDESRPALVAQLAKGPPWRQALIAAIIDSPNGPTVAYSLLSDLRKTEGEPTRLELRELISKLIAKNDFDTAYFIWLDFLSQADLRKAGQIFDGGFELDPQDLVFGWNFGKLRNADIRLVPRSTSSADRMLRIEFINTRDRFQHVSQVLRLAPGRYTLVGEMKAERLVTDVGLVWRLYCLGMKQRAISQSGKLFAASTWAPFEAPLDVPGEDCSAQKLQLEVDSRATLDQLISGQVYFDNLQIRQRR